MQRTPSNPPPGKPAQLSDNDNKIMLRMLLNEARQYQVTKRRSNGSLASSTLSSNDTSAVGGSSVTSMPSSQTSPSELSSQEPCFRRPPTAFELPVALQHQQQQQQKQREDYIQQYLEECAPAWDWLQNQVERQWQIMDSQCIAPDDKYNAIKSRLTSLFLWEIDDGERGEVPLDEVPARLNRPPQEILGEIAERQQRRLRCIPPGQLFVGQQQQQRQQL